MGETRLYGSALASHSAAVCSCMCAVILLFTGLADAAANTTRVNAGKALVAQAQAMSPPGAFTVALVLGRRAKRHSLALRRVVLRAKGGHFGQWALEEALLEITRAVSGEGVHVFKNIRGSSEDLTLPQQILISSASRIVVTITRWSSSQCRSEFARTSTITPPCERASSTKGYRVNINASRANILRAAEEYCVEGIKEYAECPTGW